MMLGFILHSCPAQNAAVNYFNQIAPGDTAKIFSTSFITLKIRGATKIVFSPDGQECLVRTDIGVLYSKQENGHWADFTHPGFLGNLRLGEPFFSPDSQRIFFSGGATADIWVSNRSNHTWTTPQLIPAPVSLDTSLEYHPTAALNGALYFCSKREGVYCIYRSQYLNGNYSTIEKLDTIINSRYGAWDPFIAPDESYMIFTSIHPDGYGKEDQYISYNKNGHWTNPKNLGSEINTDKTEYGSYVGPENTYYFFCRRTKIAAEMYWVSASFIETLREK